MIKLLSIALVLFSSAPLISLAEASIEVNEEEASDRVEVSAEAKRAREVVLRAELEANPSTREEVFYLGEKTLTFRRVAPVVIERAKAVEISTDLLTATDLSAFEIPPAR